jgi:hypothetical protein
MARMVLFIVVAGLMLELITMYFSPKTYARFAWIPFLRRSTLLTPRARAGAYRDATGAPLRLTDLGLNGLRYEDKEAVGAFADGIGWLRLRYKFLGWNRVMGVIIVNPSLDGDELRLRTRMLPASTLTMLPMVLMSPDPQYGALLGAAIVVVTGISVWMLRQRAEASLTCFLDALENRAHATLARR